MSKQVTYGLGGYDPTKPNNNIVEEIDLPDEETNETI
jgi:ribosomal protein L1